ncbi:unnamed protein product [Auanema sp. JU1783]|nr:unnamed protein product [Auanema sp. JU1783]
MSSKLAYEPYEVLGVKKGCTDRELQQAYKKACLKWHPDKNLDNKEAAEKKFIEAKEAFRFLSDPEKRTEYDSGVERDEKRAAKYKERMDRTDGARRRFIDELTRKEQAAEKERELNRNTQLKDARKRAYDRERNEQIREQLEKEAEQELRRAQELFRNARTPVQKVEKKPEDTAYAELATQSFDDMFSEFIGDGPAAKTARIS